MEHIISMGLFQISVAIGTHTAAGNGTVLAFIKNKTSSIPLHVPFYFPFHFPLHVPISMFHCIVRGDRDSRANLMPIYGDLYQIKL